MVVAFLYFLGLASIYFGLSLVQQKASRRSFQFPERNGRFELLILTSGQGVCPKSLQRDSSSYNFIVCMYVSEVEARI